MVRGIRAKISGEPPIRCINDGQRRRAITGVEAALPEKPERPAGIVERVPGGGDETARACVGSEQDFDSLATVRGIKIIA